MDVCTRTVSTLRCRGRQPLHCQLERLGPDAEPARHRMELAAWPRRAQAGVRERYAGDVRAGVDCERRIERARVRRVRAKHPCDGPRDVWVARGWVVVRRWAGTGAGADTRGAGGEPCGVVGILWAAVHAQAACGRGCCGVSAGSVAVAAAV